MQRYKILLLTIVSLMSLLLCSRMIGPFKVEAVQAQSPLDKTILLDQGWTPEIRKGYYHISQGTTVMPYDIFLNLEAAGSQDLFRSDENSERYGLTPDPADPQWNPDGLPIGLGKTVTTDGPWKGEDVGINCATCHNTELFYQGKRVRIDGGVGNHFDLEAYVCALDDAVQATLTDSAKFDRLAVRMGASNASAKSNLRKRFESNADRIHSFRTRVLLTPYPWGPSRMDAIGLIVARVTSVAPEYSPELVCCPRADQAPLPLEFSARILDTMARRTTRSNQSQPNGNDGRFHVHESDRQIARGRPLHVERSPEESGTNRGLAESPSASEMAGRGVWKNRSRESGGGQEAIRQSLCGVPQFLSLHMDRTEQVRQALH